MSRLHRTVCVAIELRAATGLLLHDCMELAGNAVIAEDAPRSDDDPRPLGLESALCDAINHRVTTKPKTYAAVAHRDVSVIAREVARSVEGP